MTIGALFQGQGGHPVVHFEIPAADSTTVIYADALAMGESHGQAALRWLEFIRSRESIIDL